MYRVITKVRVYSIFKGNAVTPPTSPTSSAAPTDAPEPEGRRARRRRELRERVFEVARELFTRQGFEATTVEQIAEKADIAPATFFNHFQSKRGVLAVMTSQVADYVSSLVESHLCVDLPIGEQLQGLATDAGQQIAANRHIARDVVLELVRMEASPEDPSPYLARVHEPVTAALAAGQARGEVRSDLDTEFLSEMVVGALNAAVTHWLSDSRYPIAERLPRAAAFVWEAIRAEPGVDRKPPTPIRS